MTPNRKGDRLVAVSIVETAPIEGQKPGTSGLRKQTRVFMPPHYLENYVQAIFDAIGGVERKTLTLGGDGRSFNDRPIHTITPIAASNRPPRGLGGQHGH